MQCLNPNDMKMFEAIFKTNQESLIRLLSKILRRKYENVIQTKDYLLAEGNIPIALVAHLDTVFKNPPNEIYYDKEKNVMWSPDGLGADDRAGVFAILKIIQTGYRPTIIFTTDEEIGGVGAEKLTYDYPEAPWKINYIIELDRCGVDDCVFYDCDNKKFISYVESFGFKEQFGSFSDISEICPAWGVAGVNLSIGYQNEHSVIETLNITNWKATIHKVCTMLRELDIPEYEYIFGGGFSYSWLKNIYSFGSCDGCGDSISEYNSIPVMRGDVLNHFCPECSVKHVGWCEKCGSPFYVAVGDPEKIKYCKDCRKDSKKWSKSKKSKKSSIE